MIIQYLIDTLLKTDIEALNFVERYGGVTKPVKVAYVDAKGAKTIKKYPVGCGVSEADCYNEGIYQNLIPDDSKKSVLYWEILTPMVNTGDTPNIKTFNNKRFRGSARLVVWLNMKELGFQPISPQTQCDGNIHTFPSLSNVLTRFGKITGGIYDGSNIKIQPQRIELKKDAIFGQYTYSEGLNYYLYPYSYYGIDVTFEMDICLKSDHVFPINSPIQCIKPLEPVTSPITTDMALWLKADAGVNGSNVEDGDFVYIWEDQSGNTRHFSQLTFNSQPQYRASVKNEKPALYFNFDSLVLQNTQIFTSLDFTVYVVSQQLVQDQQNGSSLALSVTGFTTGSNRFYLRLGKEGSNQPNWGTVGASLINLGDRNNNVNIDHAVRSGTSIDGYRNNELKGTIGYSNVLSDLIHYIGNWNNNRLIGHVFEIILYPVAHTTEEQEQNYNYLKGKYGL